MSGTSVALVGGGPGDPELLTLRAEGLLGLAGVVVADAGLVSLAQEFAGSAQIVAVPDGQPVVAVLLREVARAEGLVVRLYRGDPWLHPGYRVEQEGLARAGIVTEAVAGVAVEVAAPALAGVPVHVRHLAVACTLGAYEDVPVATDPARTLVASGPDPVAMARAMAATGDGQLPVALIPLADPAAAWRGALGDAAAAASTMPGPALLVVGAVCGTGPLDRHGVS